MATYIPGVESYLPEFKPFTPDYKFLSDVLDTKTTRYNTNYKQLNDLYSKVVYAPLSREDTQSMRAQYTDGLSQKLQKISGMDLSLMQNVDAAKGVFKPFFEEDTIVKDMVMTKTYQDERAFANRLKNDPEKERRAMYNAMHVRAMDYRMQDFIDADPESALSAPLPQYVPDVDLYNMGIDLLKEQGFEVTKDILSPGGQFIVRQTNGNLVTAEALEFLQRSFVDDPRVQEAYYTKSFVEGRDKAAQFMEQGVVSSVEDGQRMWANETIDYFTRLAAERAAEQKQELSEKTHSVTSWDIFKKKYGIVEGSEQAKMMEEKFSEYQALSQSLQTTNNIISEGLVDGQGEPTQTLLNRAYNMTMQYNLKEDLIASARQYAKMTESTQITGENPDYTRDQQFKYDQQMEVIRQMNRERLARIEAGLEGGGAARGFLDDALATPVGGAATLTVAAGKDGEVFDVLATNNQKIAGANNEIVGGKIGAVLAALPYFQPDVNGNNSYTITLGGEEVSGSLDQLMERLSKVNPEDNTYVYEEDINKLYSGYDKYLNPQPNSTGITLSDEEEAKKISQDYPSIDGDVYKNLKTRYTAVNKRQSRVNSVMVENGNHLKEQYDRIVQLIKTQKSGQVMEPKYQDVLKAINKGGLDFEIMVPAGDSYRMLSKQEFVERYVEGARAGKYEAIQGWWSRNTVLGQKSHYNENYLKNVNYRAPLDLTPPPNKFVFAEDEAMKDASELYDIMYNMLNNTQNGKYTGEAEQIKDFREDGKDINTDAIDQRFFTAYNAGSALMGRPQTGTVEDLVMYPGRQYTIDPTTIGSYGQELLRNELSYAARQITSAGDQGITIQPGNMQDEDANFDAPSDPLAEQLMNAVLRDINAYSVNPKAQKGTPPSATFTYYPVYGNPEDLEKEHAAYVFEIDQKWLEENMRLFSTGGQKDRVYSPLELAKYSTITVGFRKENDINPAREGQFNFSAVISDINYNDNHQYYNKFDKGGVIRVTRNGDGEYMGHITLQQFDDKTGGFVDLPEQSINLMEYMRGQDPQMYLDAAVYELEQKTIASKAQANNKLYQEWSAANKAEK